MKRRKTQFIGLQLFEVELGILGKYGSRRMTGYVLDILLGVTAIGAAALVACAGCLAVFGMLVAAFGLRGR